MGKRAPRLPVASAERIKITISDCDWQRIESAYGQKLSSEARRDIYKKTQEFVDRAELEQNVERVSDARDRISTIMRAAHSLRSSLDGGDHDADVHARSLIKKHFRKEGDAIDDPLRGISSDIRRLIFASEDALKELSDTKGEDFKKGEAWKRWSNGLTDIAKAHDLHGRVRKDSDKQSRSSPFVELVWELQRSVPKAHRRYSRGALAGAIVGARRQNRVG
jgi:hypothetical protein